MANPAWRKHSDEPVKAELQDSVKLEVGQLKEINVVAQDPRVDWTPEEERAAKRRFDFMVLLLLMLGFFSQHIDRRTSSHLRNAERSENQPEHRRQWPDYLIVMIVICELPSNLLLQLIGAKFWVPCQMIVWGVVAACHSEIKNEAGYYACRVALGISEAGFIPGSIYYMSTFYTKKDFAVRASCFWIGSYIGKACGGLFAAGLFRLHDHSGRSEWQWLFLVEGVISIFIGIFALIWWPHSTVDSRTLIPGFRLLTRRQEHILTNRLLIDDPAKNNTERIKIKPRDVFKAIANWRMWILFIFVVTLVAPLTCLETYNSQIVKELGFSTIKANAMSSVGVRAAIPLIVLAGRVASITGKYGICAFLFMVPYPIFTGVFICKSKENRMYGHDTVYTRA